MVIIPDSNEHDCCDDDEGEKEEEGSGEGEESEEESDEAEDSEREVVSSNTETKATNEKLLKRFNALVDEHRGKSWIKDSLPLVLEKAVQNIVAAAEGKVYAPSLALPLIKLTVKRNVKNILPLRVAIRSVTYELYI
jgi:hypothetical protein